MINSKIVYSIIPARSGSKTIKNKNIYIVNNKPLLYYSIITSKKSKLIDRTFLLTDSKKYSKIGLKYGAEIPYLRSKGVSGDKTSDLKTILDFLKQLKRNKIILPDYIVHLRPKSIKRIFLIDRQLQSFII